MYIIEQLRGLQPVERVGVIEMLYEKNCAYLSRYHPEIMQAIERIHCPYQIQLTSDFLTLTDEGTNEVCVELELDIFAEQLGDLVHDGWIEYENFEAGFGHKDFQLHHGLLTKLEEGLTTAFPKWRERYNEGQVFLQDSPSGKKNSPPVVFLGIFHGLHVARYLDLATPAKIMLIEPDANRFEVSLYFLDYQELFEGIPTIQIVLGAEIEEELKTFMPAHSVTPIVWLRVLPVYSSNYLQSLAKKIFNRQRGCLHSLTPLDLEFSVLQREEENIAKELRILSSRPAVSSNVQIAIVASGDSLAENMEWLKDNRENVLLFAVHSAVIPLKKAGLTPDLQFAKETPESQQILNMIRFERKVPLVLSHMASEELIHCVDLPLLVPEQDEITSVDYGWRLRTGPATENFAMEMALFLRPARIFLVGVDCAETASEDAGTVIAIKSAGDGTVDVQSNYPELSGKVKANLHHNRIRVGLENSLGRRDNLAIEVYNLSDGAYITGALPVRKEKLSMPEYAERESDLCKIVASFKPAKQGENWNTFSQSGKSVLRTFIHKVNRKLFSEHYSWADFSTTLDTVVTEAQKEMHDEKEPADVRSRCFTGIITDLLRSWYRTLMFCHNDAEGEIVYRNGLVLVENILEEMEWPDRRIQPLVSSKEGGGATIPDSE